MKHKYGSREEAFKSIAGEKLNKTMNFEDYKKELDVLQKDFEIKKMKLAVEYCDLNNPYKLGDTIEDHIGKIRLESIKYRYNYNEPTCIYYGLELKKNGEPMKRMPARRSQPRASSPDRRPG